MKVEQIHSLMNKVTSEILGKSELLKEDLSNVVDVGTEIFNSTDVDNYVKSLVNQIGKVVFVNRPYSGSVPSVVMDSWEFGSVLEKIQADIPQAIENDSWDLTDGKSYDTNVFYKPSVSAKFFNKKVTFEVAMSFTELQVKESFSNANQLNGFLSMLYNSVEKSMTVKIDSLVMRTINNMIGETIYHDLYDSVKKTVVYTNTGVKAVNLLKMFNDKFTKTLTPNQAITDSEFLKFASYTMQLYVDRLSKISTLFNIGGKERFTTNEMLKIVLLSEFKASAISYLQADTYNDELVALPNAETVPYWQGPGLDYGFEDTSKINVALSKYNDTVREIETSGIIGVMFDRDSLGVTNLDRRVTTNYNAKAEFYNNYYKFDSGYFNDLNENFVVFFMH